MQYEQFAPHEQRVVDEAEELKKKISSLVTFFNSTIFISQISEAEQVRLRNQYRFMEGYCSCLIERIAAFTAANIAKGQERRSKAFDTLPDDFEAPH